MKHEQLAAQVTSLFVKGLAMLAFLATIALRRHREREGVMVRTFVGAMFVKIGMAILPRDVRKLVRDILMYHVPGALTEQEKAGVRASKEGWVK